MLSRRGFLGAAPVGLLASHPSDACSDVDAPSQVCGIVVASARTWTLRSIWARIKSLALASAWTARLRGLDTVVTLKCELADDADVVADDVVRLGAMLTCTGSLRRISDEHALVVASAHEVSP